MGYDEVEDLNGAYSTACSGPTFVPQFHTFPRSYSNASNVSAASSLDSMDYPASVGPVEDEWNLPYNNGFSMENNLDNYHTIHEFGAGPFDPVPVQVISAPLMSTSYSQDHEPQQPQPLQFHHLNSQSSTASPALLPSSIPLTPPLSTTSSVVGGPTKGNMPMPSHLHHQFSIQSRPQTFKRPFQSEPMVTTMSAGSHSPPSAKRRKSVSSANLNPKSPKQSTPLTDDDTLLLKLKDEENLPWKLIQKRFLDLDRGDFKVPTLQMRYKRLKEKMRVWEVDDVGYLKEAKDAVSKEFWEMVSRKMVEMGCKKKIPGVACERKWRELDGGENRDISKSASPKLEEGMASPPATRSPSRRSSVSGQGLQILQPAPPPVVSQLPLPSTVMQQLAAGGQPPALEMPVVQVKRELCTVTEGDEM